MSNRKPRQLPGIRTRNGGYTAYVRVAGRVYRKQFPAGTPTSHMIAWHDQQRVIHGTAPAPKPLDHAAGLRLLRELHDHIGALLRRAGGAQ